MSQKTIKILNLPNGTTQQQIKKILKDTKIIRIQIIQKTAYVQFQSNNDIDTLQFMTNDNMIQQLNNAHFQKVQDDVHWQSGQIDIEEIHDGEDQYITLDDLEIKNNTMEIQKQKEQAKIAQQDQKKRKQQYDRLKKAEEDQKKRKQQQDRLKKAEEDERKRKEQQDRLRKAEQDERKRIEQQALLKKVEQDERKQIIQKPQQQLPQQTAKQPIIQQKPIPQEHKQIVQQLEQQIPPQQAKTDKLQVTIPVEIHQPHQQQQPEHEQQLTKIKEIQQVQAVITKIRQVVQTNILQPAHLITKTSKNFIVFWILVIATIIVLLLM